jgi:hypothetical protein
MDSGGVACSLDVSGDLAVLGNVSMDGGNVSIGGGGYGSSFVDVSGGLSVTGESQFYGGFYVSEVSAFGDTVVIDGNCVLNGTNNFFVGIIDISGDTSIGGDVILYKDVDVVGNADICGNVMLTSGSSAEQRVQIRATTASTTTTSGALVVSGGAGVEGNVNVGGNVGITENVFVGGKMDIMGNVDICGNVFCSSEPRFPSELTNKKYVDSLNRGSYGYYWKREYYRSYRFYVAHNRCVGCIWRDGRGG